MARLTRCLPLFSFVVFFISSAEGSHRLPCHRVFPLQLTAAAMPCQYICAYYDGYTLRYGVRGEDDGTPCHKYGKSGVCWNRECLTRYWVEDEWSQQASVASKVPLRIRKRDVGSVTKGATVTKTVETNGDSGTTIKTVNVIKTVKSGTRSEGVKSAAAAGLEGNYITGFNTQQSTGTKSGISNGANVDVDPFAIKTASARSQTGATLFSRGTQSPRLSQTVKNGGVRITVRRGPNGQIVRTRTVKKFIITKGPTTTVRRIVIRHGHTGIGGNLIQPGRNMVGTKTVQVSFSRGSTGGANGLIVGGKTDVSRKTSQVTTLRTTTSARQNPIYAIVHKTIKQERILGGQTVGGAPTAAKTVSTVAVTQSVRPSLSIQVTKQAVTPLKAASSGTSNTATLRGVEVELPGYTAGLRHNWKWVLARRVGVYPPYVQALDPDVLFYKLGLRKPNLPSLPAQVLHILNQVPVHPVGSDLYGYLLSRKILEKIHGFTDGVNRLTRLGSMLSTTNTSNQGSSNLLNSLLATTQSSPSGSNFLQKLLLASMTGSGNNPLNSQYGGYLSSPDGGLFGRPYAGPYDSPLAPLLAGQFPASSWPLYNELQKLRRFGLNPLLRQQSPLDSYDSSGSASGSTDMHYTLSENGNLVPSTGMPTSKSSESYIKSLLSSMSTDSDTMGRRYGQPNDETLTHASEKLARVLGEEKLRHLLDVRRERDSPVRRILKAFYRREYENAPRLLKRLGVRPNTRLYNRIMHEIEFKTKHRDLFGLSKPYFPHETESDKTRDLIFALRELRRKTNDDNLRFPSINEPRSLESFESSRVGSHRSDNELTTLLQSLRRRPSSNEYSSLDDILLASKKHRQPAGSHDALDTSNTREEVIDALLDYSRRHPSPHRTSRFSKQITKALLSSRHGPISTHGGTDGVHLSKLVSVQGTTRTEARPHGLTDSREIYTKYHTQNMVAPAKIPFSPATVSGLEITRQITPQPQPAALLGFNRFSTSLNGQATLQPYPQVVSQAFYPTGGSSVSDQAALLNGQFVASTDSLYGRPQSQPATTMMNGMGGYSAYTTMPTNAAYVSQYATQPFYLGATSLYGSHPHYVVEGHEAPGTRWQLKVWRQHPTGSYVAPGLNGFQSSHLGSVVTRARETVTRGLQLGSQPGQFGFTTYGSTLSGGNIVGGASQYVVRAPDGSIVLSRQPLGYGSPTQGTSTSSVLVSQTTKQTTKKTSETPLLPMNGALSSSSLQSAVEGASSEGTTKPDSFSELTQTKDSSLLKSTASGSDTENTESSFSRGGASSSSLQADADLSQSKLRR